MRPLTCFFCGLALLVVTQGVLPGQVIQEPPKIAPPPAAKILVAPPPGAPVVPGMPGSVLPPGLPPNVQFLVQPPGGGLPPGIPPNAKIIIQGPPGFAPPAYRPYPPGRPSLAHLNGQKLVFIVDGAGGNTAVADNLQDLAGDMGLRIRFQMVNWCRLDHKAHDFVDRPAQMLAANRLAGWTRLIHCDAPCAEIYYIGQDAGAHVILAAASQLPPGTITRIVTIAPGVWSRYDLRPALRATTAGLDNFWSSEDDFLERIVEKRGTCEGSRGYAAGRVGFNFPPFCDPCDRALYVAMIRQHKWNDELCGLGGHHSWTFKHNLKKCLVPLFYQPQLAYAPPALASPLTPYVSPPMIAPPMTGPPMIAPPMIAPPPVLAPPPTSPFMPAPLVPKRMAPVP